MGVDLKVCLFNRVEPLTVVKVLAILDGVKPAWSDAGQWVEVESAAARGIEAVSECCRLTWNSPTDGNRFWLWHHNLDYTDFAGSIPRSTAKNIALACGLVDFFGGFVQFNDCDEFPKSYLGHPEGVIWHPNNGAMWKAFQEAMFNLKPLTRADIAKFENEAAYRFIES